MENKILKITIDNKDYYKGTDIGKLLDVKIGKYYKIVDKEFKKTINHDVSNNAKKRSVFLDSEGIVLIINELKKNEEINLIIINKIHEIYAYIGYTGHLNEKDMKHNEYVTTDAYDDLSNQVDKLVGIVSAQEKSIKGLVSIMEKQDRAIKKIRQDFFIKKKKSGWRA